MGEIKPKVVNWGPNEIWRIKKNIGVITVALMIHYTASNGALNLQSSINAEAGLGTAALLSMFIGVLVASMFLASMVIKCLGVKWTVCFSFIAYMPFISFQMYPRFATLVPAAFLMGVGSGIKICAKSTYIAVLAEAHSMISKIPASKTLLSFSGCYFMIVQMSQFWGNLISSLVLSAANNASVTSVNETLIPHICGSNFLPNLHAVKALPAQPPEKIRTLAGIYLTCIMVAMLLIVTTLDPIKRYEICRKGSGNGLSGFGLLAATIKQLTADINQQLLLAITIFIGLEQGFFAADFTASFVSCAIGTGSVGYVMMTFGICNAVGCIATTYLAKLLNRLPLICAAASIHCGLLVTLLAWRPHGGDFNVMLIIAGLWGICDSTWAVQITTYYGVLFRGKEEAAYSNLGLWEGVGYIISFAMSSYVRTRFKVYLLLCFLVAGAIGYLIVEYRSHKRKSKAEKQDLSRNNTTICEKERLAEAEKLTMLLIH